MFEEMARNAALSRAFMIGKLELLIGLLLTAVISVPVAGLMTLRFPAAAPPLGITVGTALGA